MSTGAETVDAQKAPGFPASTPPGPTSPASPDMADGISPAAPEPEGRHHRSPGREVKAEPEERGEAPADMHDDTLDAEIETPQTVTGLKREVEDGEEPESDAKKQRVGENNPSSSGSPSMSAEVKDEPEGKNSEREDRDTPPPSWELRRGSRAATKKPVATRQLNGKNFLKNILPNIIRLSRTEILQDLRVMEGNAKAR